MRKREDPQLDVQELELKQQPASHERIQETQEMPPDPAEKTREAPSNPEQESRGASSDLEEETRGAPSDPEETQERPPDPEERTQGAPPDPVEEIQVAPSDIKEETKNEAGPAAGLTDLDGPIAPALWVFTISGNLPPNIATTHVGTQV